ncbi:MAG: M48 family metalloprotease [Alphaproteobacteria bacterium]|nr:M48 family metalloprotease [Alphaproteobacteria bacterium]
MKKLRVLFYAVCLMPYALFARADDRRLIQDTEIESVLQELIEPLAAAAGMPPGRLRAHVINNDEFNAFVMAGEDIFIHSGLIARIESPIAFQGVVAHELGHMSGGHIAQMSDRARAEMIRSMIVQALGVGMMVAGGNPSAGMGVVAGGQGIQKTGMLSFNREEERLADYAAVDLMAKAGVDPNGLLIALKQMNDMMDAAEKRIDPNRAAHPFTSERIKYTREKISQLGKFSKKPENPNYVMVRAKIIGYLWPADRVAMVYPASDKSVAADYARTISAMRAGNLTAARTGASALIAARPRNPYFHELLGDIEYQSGNYDESVRAYEKSLSIKKDSPQIQTALALVLTERRAANDADRAVEMCKRALISSPSPFAYWVLSRAENIRGNKGVADWAMAEFYSMNRDKDKAKTFAKRAQAALPPDSPEYIKAGELL